MKRTQRIEIIRYTRRVSRPHKNSSEAAGEKYAAAISAISLIPADTRFDQDRTDYDNGQAVEVEARTAQRHPWFWLEWLKR